MAKLEDIFKESPPTTAASKASSAGMSPEHKEDLLCVLLGLAIVFAYVWIVSAGTIVRWHQYGSYYDYEARGFLAGHTSLSIEPDPRLFKLANPYDPKQNVGIRLHDASLHNGKYYLYYGPAPAVVLAVLRAIGLFSGRDVGDQYVVFVSLCGALVFTILLIRRMRRSLFSELPWWTTGVAVAAAGVAAPNLFLLARPNVHEAAIATGQFGMLAGLFFSMCAIDSRRRKLLLLAAGLAWAIAIGARFSLTPAIGAVAVLILVVIWRRGGSIASCLTGGAVLFTPIAAALLGLAVFNFERFGSIGEFGTRYQLANMNGLPTPAPDVMFSTRYVAPNLYRALFETPRAWTVFPYLSPSIASKEWIRANFQLPPEYLIEAMAGLVFSTPFLYFGIVAVAVLLFRAIRRTADVQAATSAWLSFIFVVVGVLSAIPILLIVASTPRYLADFSPSIHLLACIGMWQTLEIARKRKWSANPMPACVALATANVFVGILVTQAISTYYDPTDKSGAVPVPVRPMLK